MKKTSAKLIFTVLAGVCFSWSSLYGGYGTAGARILNLKCSARISAMGNAFAGLSDDLNAVVYNPAGLSLLYGTEFQFTRLVYLLDSGMSSVTYGQKIGRFGLGVKVKLFTADDTYRDEVGYNEKEFGIRYSQYTVGAGYPLFLRHSLGVAVNVVTEDFQLEKTGYAEGDISGRAVGFDIGWLYRGYRGDSFGLVLRNIGGRINTGSEKSPLPAQYVLGGGHRMGKFLFVWEIFTGREISFGWECGLEAEMSGFSVRSGFMYLTNPDISFGFGLPYKNWRLDYAFSPHQDLGTAHRVSLGFYF
ncbi:MAG: UPF0164 family protein [Elusimicrobiota bacterium]